MKDRVLHCNRGVESLLASRLLDLFDINVETGVFLWKVSKGRNAKPGREAGFLKKNGYIGICIDQKEYYAHRLMWLHAHGKWPDASIDHIDRDRTNNAIKNLREATAKQNAENMRRSKANTSGHHGVHFHKRLRSKPWSANITHNGKTIHVGYFATANDAAFARRAAEEAHFTHHTK